VGRARVALERFAAMVSTLLVMGLAGWLAMVAVSGPARLDGVSPLDLASAGLQLTLFGAAIGSVSFGIGAATGRRGLAVSVASAVAVVGYLAMGVFPQFGPLEWTRRLSPWEWYLGGRPLANGVQPLDCGLLVATAVAFVAAGTWLFTRRDIGVQ
jgi:ABC-2 type transport system permease protein